MMPKFKAIDIFPGGSKVSTGFGWDIGPINVLNIDPNGKVWPRIHHAIDRYSLTDMFIPFDCDKTQWIPKDGQGCSCLRLFYGAAELRMLHINESEFDKTTFAKVKACEPVKKGERIGPNGDTGISFGRHLHYSFIVQKGAYDEELNNKFGDYWKENRKEDMIKSHGQKCADQISSRGISIINNYAIFKADPYWPGEVIILNTEKVFE